MSTLNNWLQRVRHSLRKRPARRGVSAATPVESLEDRALLAVFTVLNTSDEGAGSLRQAIEDANSSSGSDTVEFQLPGTGPQTINLQSGLPALTERITIDGWSQNGHISAPLIVVNGSQAGAVSGFDVRATNSTIRGLVIQGFDGDGIVVDGASATIIQGNYIGTNAAGTSAVGNSGAGIRLLNGASGTRTGNDLRSSTESKVSTKSSTTQTLEQERERNIISGNQFGIVVEGGSTIGNGIHGNYIGTTATGQAAIPNTEFGILFEESGGNVVGGVTADHQNVISGNGRDGIRIEAGATDQVIEGNLIGVAADGTTALGNGGSGVRVLGSFLRGENPTIVYTIDVSGSTSSRFQGTAVGDVNSDGNSNSILDAELAGFIALTQELISLGSGDNASIGIVVFGARAATLDMDPVLDGIQFTTKAVADADGNGSPDVIDILSEIRSGHAGVGTSSTSFSDGIDISTSTFNGAADFLGSSANLIFVSDGFDNGNPILDFAGLNSLGVQRTAIGMGNNADLAQLQVIDPGAVSTTSSDEFSNRLLSILGGGIGPSSSTRITIGGTDAGMGNVIAHNVEAGVSIGTKGNRILGNSIHSNGGLGIDLIPNGVTPNDPGDLDIGANLRTNFPVINDVVPTASGLDVNGILSALPDSTYRIEVFGLEAADASGHGEGRRFLGTFDVTTDSNGLANFDESLAASLTGLRFLSMTATDSNGNTSEFSEAFNLFSFNISISDAAANEADGTMTFTLAANRPIDIPINVDVSFAGGNATGGIDYDATTQTVTIPANSTAGVALTVPVIDDPTVEGVESFTASLASSTNQEFRLIDFSDTGRGSITDNDAPGFLVTETGGDTVVEESGTTDEFTVVLTQQPESVVIFNIVSGDVGEATPDVSVLQFTPSNWDSPQTVVVTGVDDPDFDGDQLIDMTVSVRASTSDRFFSQLAPQTVPVTVIDNDAPAIQVFESGGSTVVREPGTSDTFGVRLRAEPAEDVVLTLSNDNTVEASIDQQTLTFTSTNWHLPQPVTVTAFDDFVIDGTQLATVTISVNDAASSTEYRTVSDKTVVASVLDDDFARLTIIESDGVTVVNESGNTDTFDVLLRAQPLTDVVVTVASADNSQAVIRPTTLTFTAANWNVRQTVTVTGVDNSIIDGTRLVTVNVGVDDANSDAVFASLPDEPVDVTVIDDDGPGFSVTQSGGSTIVDESGTTDELLVVLTQLPSTNVTLQVSIDIADEASIDNTSLTFTPSNWNVPQLVTVTGLDDFALDGNQSSLITVEVDAANSDDAFDQAPDEIVTAITNDDDAATFTIIESDGFTTVDESGSEDTFLVILNAQPATDVVIDVSSSDTTEATIDTARLTFSPANWMSPRTVKVIGLDDIATDGDQIAPINLSVNDQLSDNEFDSASDQTVSATVVDDDIAGVTVTESGGSTDVSEPGTQDTFDVQLSVQPVADVVLSLVNLAPGDASIDQNRLTFTPANWDTPQTVTVTAIDNDIVDGQRTAPTTINVNTSQSDVAFAGVFQQVVNATIADDDAPGFIINESNDSSVVGESGAIDSFEVTLTARPDTPVVLTVVSNNENEVTVDQAVLTFSPQSWNVPRVVTLLGQDDSFVDGGTITPVTVGVDANASDAKFGQVPSQNVNVTNVDDDVAAFALTASDLATTVDESGTFDQLQVVLTARPVTNVVLTVTSSDTTESTVDKSEITFTPAMWNIPQIINVIGSDDNQLDGNRTSTISVGVNDAASDFRFRDLPDQSVVAITEDDDVAGFLTDKTTGSVHESGTTDTFGVTLTASPVAPVVIDVRSEDPGEVVVSPLQLTFNTNDWNVPQIVTVTGFPDNTADGDQTTGIRLSINAEASHSGFDALEDQIVTVITADADSNDRPFVLGPMGKIDEVRPTLRWSSVPDAVSYEFSLNQVGGENNPVISRNVFATSHIVTQNLTVGRYRTWVRAELSDGTFTEFDNKTFEVTASVQIHDLPFFGSDTKPQISWDAVDGAVEYRIQINNSTTGERQIVDTTVSGTTFTPPESLGFGRHQFWIRPIGPANVQSKWSVEEYYLGPKPVGPQGSVSTASPDFSWTTIAGAATYHLYVVGPGGVLINEAGLSGTTYTVATPFVNGDFRWWIRASTAAGKAGVWSEPAEFSTGSRTKVTAPRGTITTAIPEFDWPAVPNAESYEIYVSRVGTPGALYRQAGLTSTRYPSPVLTDGDYKVWIRTKTAAGSVWGRSIDFTVATAAINRSTTPLTPDGPGLDRTPQFGWRPTSEVTSYELYLHDGTTAILQTGITDVTWTPPNDLSLGEWTWSIRPLTAAGAGVWSTPLAFNTSGQTRLISPGATTTSSRPLIRWQAVAGAGRYILQINNLTTGNTQVIRENNLPDTSFRSSSVMPLGEYRVWVRAIGSVGTGLWSRQMDFEIIAAAQPNSNSEPDWFSEEFDSLLAVFNQQDQETVPATESRDVEQRRQSSDDQEEVNLSTFRLAKSNTNETVDKLMAALGTAESWME